MESILKGLDEDILKIELNRRKASLVEICAAPARQLRRGGMQV